MTRAVLFAGGWAHPGKDLIAAVQGLLFPRGIDVAVVTNAADAASEVDAGCDLLVVGSCWFSMTDERYNEEQRAEFAVKFAAPLRASLQRLKDAGCPLLALHTAVICFDGADLWSDWLGGSWNWETSWHPAPEPMAVKPVSNDTLEVEEFAVTDELYQGLDVHDEVTLAAESAAGDPLVWLNETGVGRSAVNLLGHDFRSLDHPGHEALNNQLLDWLLG
jgi:hypothetical protein